jgi:hypothetical protein
MLSAGELVDGTTADCKDGEGSEPLGLLDPTTSAPCTSEAKPAPASGPSMLGSSFAGLSTSASAIALLPLSAPSLRPSFCIGCIVCSAYFGELWAAII